MELEDFKSAWNKKNERSITLDSLEQKVNQIEKSGQKIRRAFIVESVIHSAIYLFFIGMIIIFHQAMRPFLYKLVAILFIGFLPTVYRLYQSQVWINALDYTNDIRSNLLAFLTYYKTTLKWYWWSSIIICVLMFIILFTDSDFLAMGIEWKIGTCAYIILVLLLTRPYLKKVYGRRVNEFEIFLK